MKTKAHEKTPKETYGKQTHRGNIGEQRAARILREQGYTVSLSKTHPRGACDIIARKGNETRNIQVKRISSRALLTADAARNRIRGKPFLIQRIPQDREVWVFDKENRLYIFGGKHDK